MRSLLLKLLEMVGRVRLPMIRSKTPIAVGRPDAPDFRGTFDWRKYLEARALSAVWGPRSASQFLPFHCITLFASVDYFEHGRLGPCTHDPFMINDYDHPPWIDASTLLLVDLSGPESVALGAALGTNGCDLVCTFNNWPHPDGLIRPQNTLAALLRYASWLSEKRVFPATPAPVAWLCDADRLGTGKGKPGQFDNRYYIEDAILPGPRFLKDRGITSVYYVCAVADTVLADLADYLAYLQKEGIRVRQVIATDGVLSVPMACALRTASFSKIGFFRSSAGGFGAPVPHPSSGGG